MDSVSDLKDVHQMLGNDYHLTSNMFSFPALHSPHYAGAGDLMDITCSTLLHPSETEDRSFGYLCHLNNRTQNNDFEYVSEQSDGA